MTMDYDIPKYFVSLIQEARSFEIAESIFKRNLTDDDNLLLAYREWCEEQGFSERSGFKEFYQQLIDSRKELLDSLNDYDFDEL